MFQLVKRDYTILKEVYRWRVCLGRHIQELTGFASRNACEQRLRKLIEMGYLERKYILYGVPGLYSLTHKGKVLINVSRKAEKIRLEQVSHDITVLDTAIFFMQSMELTIEQIKTEKELQMREGFGNRKHRPDFVIENNGKTICVEVELSPKSKSRTEQILKDNYMQYDSQIWIVPNKKHKVATLLNEYINHFPNMKIIELKKIKLAEI